MKYRSLIAVIVVFLIMLISSCADDIINRDDFVPSIVVDGRIENGDYPRVFLTRNIPYYVNIDSTDLPFLVVRQAKVTVSNGTDSEVLTLYYDKNVFPPFYYQGVQLKGEAGKTYLLTVNYGSNTLTSSTTIPAPVIPDSVWCKAKADEPDKFEILVKLRDNAAEKNFYKMYTQVENGQKTFYPSLISNFEDNLFNGEVFTFHLDKGPESYLNLNQKDFSFSRNDTVLVKVCTLDEVNFEFWRSYQNEISNGANPFASSYHLVNSNINGGIGIWGGFGTNICRIIVK